MPPAEPRPFLLRSGDPERQVAATLIGLKDAALSGWYHSDSNEMFSGFPISAADVLIDVGCGDGGPASFAAARGAELVLTDVVADRLEKAAERCRKAGARQVTTFVSNSAPLPIDSDVGTRIVCSEVLEHVDDPAVVLAELVRVGKPGALYLLTTPDPVGEEMQKHLAPGSYFAKPNHIRIFSREGFGEAIEASGLVIERRDYYGFYWAMWWLLFWCADVPLEKPDHPLLNAWTETWSALLDLEGGLKTKRVFDRLMPKSQVIVARKPS